MSVLLLLLAVLLEASLYCGSACWELQRGGNGTISGKKYCREKAGRPFSFGSGEDSADVLADTRGGEPVELVLAEL